MKKLKISFLFGNGLFLQHILEKFRTTFKVTSVEINSKTRKLPIPFRIYIPFKIQSYLRKDVIFVEWVGDILHHVTKRRRKGKVIARCHRGDYFENRGRINWQNVNKVIFVCYAMQKRFIEDYPEFKEKSTVVYNAINLEEFKDIKEKTTFDGRIAILGNMLERKRIYDLVFAFKKLLEKDRGYTLHIGGKGTEYQTKMIQELVEKLELDDKVIIYGYVEDKNKWLNSMDVIVGNSVHESFHYMLHEGALCGCYPLSHFWDGVEEFLPQENIFSSQEDFVNKVIEISRMSKEEKYEKIEKIKRRIVDEHDSNKIYEKLKKVILET